MKFQTSKNSLLLILTAMLALPLAARAQVVFSDDFETYGDQTSLANDGYTFTTDDVGYFQGISNGSTGSNAQDIDQNDYSFGYSTTSGHQFALLRFDGIPNGTNTTINLALTKANTGATFAFGTTYTLTYLVAPTSLPLTLSLLSGNTTLASASNAATGTNAFAAGNTVTFDTLGNPTLIGMAIGYSASISGDVQYDRQEAFDDVVITATKDINVPEPSTYALMLAGLALLVGLKLRSVRA